MHTGTQQVNNGGGSSPKLVRKSTGVSGTFRRVSRDLSPEENDSARLWMRDLLRMHDQNQSALAPKIGMVPSGISRFLAGKQGTSRATCERMAVLLNVSVEEVLGHVPRSAAPPVAPDIYPERARALARLRGILPPVVEEQVRSVFLDEEGPAFSELKWVQWALLKLQEHEASEALASRIVGPAKARRQ